MPHHRQLRQFDGAALVHIGDEDISALSPVRFLQRRRVLEAMHFIETSTMTIEDVAEQVGYQDGTALRKIIKRELGTTPSSLRS